MRNQLEPWERGILCSLWHRAELTLMDERAKTPQHLLKVMDKVVRDMRWEYKPKPLVGQSHTPIDDKEAAARIKAFQGKKPTKGLRPGR